MVRPYHHCSAVDEYLYSLLPPRDEVLAEMEAQATQHKVPIVGPAVGRILYQLARSPRPRRCSNWARPSAIRPSGGRARSGNGTCDLYRRRSEERGAGSPNFDRAGVSKRIAIGAGDALEFLSEEKQEFDIIFNDVDKEDYPRVFRLALPRLRKGGLFITDNVLWSGRVTEKNPNETTKAIQEFNDSSTSRTICSRRFCRSEMEWQLR